MKKLHKSKFRLRKKNATKPAFAIYKPKPEDNALQKKIAALEAEREQLLAYIHDYQAELAQYADSLKKFDKCTEAVPKYAEIDIRRKIERQANSQAALWEWIERFNAKKPGEDQGVSKNIWIFNPLAHWHYRQLKKANYKPIMQYYANKGEAKTAALLASLPVHNAIRAKIWSDISRNHAKKDRQKSVKYAAWAWMLQPRPYRLKFLAFRLHENGESELALHLLESLPPEMQFSESEHRYLSQIKNAVTRHKNEEAEKKTPELIQAVMITDDNYLLPTLVTAHSLLKSNSSNNIKLHILYTGTAEIEAIFQAMQNPHFLVEIHKISEEEGDFFLHDEFHVSKTALVKFRLPEIFSALKKILYLDSDLLILGDLQELWRHDLTGVYGAFVKDIKPTLKYDTSQLVRLGIEENGFYFNSGVMLLNLAKMRQDDCQKKLLEYRLTGLNYFMDQDALNVVLGKKAKFIDLRYNFLLTLLDEFDSTEINKEYGIQLESELPNVPEADIIHFCSKDKPWNSSILPYADLWLKQLIAFLEEYADYLPENLGHLGNYNKIIVSLTSYGFRVQTVDQVIRALKKQSLAPAKIILWLSLEEFPEKLENLPCRLTELQDSQFEIRFCKNLKSFKKLVPTLRLHEDRIIATADDDQHYNQHWLWELFQGWIWEPNLIHCHRTHKLVFSFGQLDNYSRWLYNHKQKEASGLLFPTGCGGILYPPFCFMPEILNEEKFMELCPTGDDIWFWAMAHMKNRRFRRVPNSTYETDPIEGTQEESLFHDNIAGNMNDEMLRKVLFYYPFIKKQIWEEEYGGN